MVKHQRFLDSPWTNARTSGHGLACLFGGCLLLFSACQESVSDDDDDDAVGEVPDYCDEVVSPGGDRTIQEAADESEDGEVICLAPGTYYENLMLDGFQARLVGYDGAETTILDGSGAGSVVSIRDSSGTEALLEGLSLTHGWAEYGGGLNVETSSVLLGSLIVAANEASASGGGFSLEDSTLDITDVVITDNAAGTYAGGMYQSGGEVFLLRSTVERNVTLDGADPLSGGGIKFRSGSLSIRESSISENEVPDDCRGGAIAASGDELLLERTIVSGNSSQGSAIRLDGDIETVLSNVSVETNYGGDPYAGSAVFMSGEGSFTASNSRFANNDGRGFGSEMQAVVSIVNCVFEGNGGGGLGTGYSTVSIENTVFSGNTGGPGVYFNSAGSYSIVNSIVYENREEEGGVDAGGIWVRNHDEMTSLVIENCDVWGNAPADFGADFGELDNPIGDDGNISVDPSFTDCDDGEGYHLATDSPLIDAGRSEYSDPDGSRSDIGAYGGDGADDWDLDWDGFFEWWRPGCYETSGSAEEDCDDSDSAVYPGQGC